MTITRYVHTRGKGHDERSVSFNFFHQMPLPLAMLSKNSCVKYLEYTTIMYEKLAEFFTR